MTRYQYDCIGQQKGVYYVSNWSGVIGRVVRNEPPHSGWSAYLLRDPLIVGRGGTRDAAVEDALRQVGGLG